MSMLKSGKFREKSLSKVTLSSGGRGGRSGGEEIYEISVFVQFCPRLSENSEL